MLLLTSLSVQAFDVRSNRQVSPETQGKCDSIYIAGEKGFAVKNVTVTKKNVSFVVCDSTDNQVRKVPWTQIQYVKKADGRIISADTILEQHVEDLLLITIFSILLGIILITGIIVWVKASKYRKKIHGHPNEKKLRKQLNWAVWLSFITGLITIILTILILYFFSLF